MPLPITDTLRAQLARFLKSEHSRTIVHGYKELLHLLGAVDLDMDLPMFDTKLAGYLAQPDFHADSLKQAAEHFLDIHFTETEQPSQGTLDFDDDQVDIVCVIWPLSAASPSRSGRLSTSVNNAG